MCFSDTVSCFTHCNSKYKTAEERGGKKNNYEKKEKRSRKMKKKMEEKTREKERGR